MNRLVRPTFGALLIGMTLAFPTLAQDRPADREVPTAGSSERPAEKTELQGTWIAEGGPERLPSEDIHYAFDGDRYDFRFEDPSGYFRLNGDVFPKQIDFNCFLPDGTPVTLQAIYSLDGDRLRLAFPKMDERSGRVENGRIIFDPRPRSFDEKDIESIDVKRVATLPQPEVVFGFERPAPLPIAFDFDDAGRAGIGIGSHFVVWDVGRRRVLNQGNALGGIHTSLDYYPDGSRFAVALGPLAGEVWIYDSSTDDSGTRIEGFDRALVSPDSTRLALWKAKENGAVQIRDAVTLEVVFETERDRGTIVSVAFQPGGKTVAVRTAGEAVIDLYDLSQGKRVGELDLSPDVEDAEYLTSMAFDPGGTHLAVAERIDGEDRISKWNVEQRERIGFYLGAPAPSALAFSPDGKMLASGSQYGALDLRNAETGEAKVVYRPVRTSDHDLPAVTSILFSSDGRRLAASGPSQCHVWRLDGVEDEQARTVLWPDWDPEDRYQALLRGVRFVALAYRAPFIDREKKIGRRPADYRDDEGKATISWRIDLLSPDRKPVVRSAVRLKEPWDSAWNRRAIPFGAADFGSEGVDPEKTLFQLATGPTTAYDGSEKEIALQNPRFTLMIVEASADRAVNWSEPRDFEYDPERPRAGLREGGFHAMTWEGMPVFVRADIPDDALRLLFSVEAEAGEKERYYQYCEPFDAQLYRPQPGRR